MVSAIKLKLVKKSSLIFRAIFFLLCITGFSLFLGLSPAFSEISPRSFDHSAWQKFLQSFVNEKGEVDYRGVTKDPSLLVAYLNKIAALSPQDVTETNEAWPREERLALLINLYNASIINAIRQHYPVHEMHNIPNVWEIQNIKYGPKKLSLDRLKLENLIGVYRDEKIYFALACGAKACPRLIQEAYTGPRVEGQLFLAVREFVNDPNRNRIIPGKKKIEISRLFQWYGSDFNLDFGVFENDRGLPPSEFSILSFLAYYLEDAAKVTYLEDGNFKIKYLPFDWSLNEWNRDAA